MKSDQLLIKHVAPEDLEPSEHHIRTEHTAPSEQFKQSIETAGVVKPLQGRQEKGKIRLLDGVRRARAAAEVGIDVVPVIVRDCDDAEAISISLTLNDDEAGVRKSVHEDDRERSVNRLADDRGNDVDVEKARLGLWSEADRIQHKLDPVSGVGPETAESLADQFGSLERMREVHWSALTDADNVGERTARAIDHHLNSDDDEEVGLRAH